MSNKARPLGNIARSKVAEVDCLLVHVWKLLEPQARGDIMLAREAELVGLRARADIAEARRLISETLAMKE